MNSFFFIILISLISYFLIKKVDKFLYLSRTRAQLDRPRAHPSQSARCARSDPDEHATADGDDDVRAVHCATTLWIARDSSNALCARLRPTTSRLCTCSCPCPRDSTARWVWDETSRRPRLWSCDDRRCAPIECFSPIDLLETNRARFKGKKLTQIRVLFVYLFQN